MRWISHLAIAGATCAVFSPAHVAVAMLGGIAPDWMERLALMRDRRKTRHRAVTHYIVFWLAAVLFFLLIWDFGRIGIWFAIGGCIHWVCDSLNATGVPIGWWSDRRVHLFGGRLRLGSGAEYATALAWCVVCVMAIYAQRGEGTRGYLPFFTPWAQHYADGIITAQEWREKRLNFF